MNKITLIGRLTQEPELRYTTKGKAVCNFRIAVKRRFAKQNEQVNADFFTVIVWQKTGEFCSNYFHKGQQVAINGRLQNRSWLDEEGNKHYITEVIADEAYFADGKKNTSSEVTLSENSLYEKVLSEEILAEAT